MAAAEGLRAGVRKAPDDANLLVLVEYAGHEQLGDTLLTMAELAPGSRIMKLMRLISADTGISAAHVAVFATNENNEPIGNPLPPEAPFDAASFKFGVVYARDRAAVPTPPFFKNLHRAENVGGDILRLPEGIQWFDDDSIVSRDVFVRPCYRALYDRFLPLKRAVLLGTPGIGKSTAVLYFIWRLLTDDSRAGKPDIIIYREQQHEDTFIVFHAGRVSLTTAAGIRAYPNDTSVLQIYDGVEPQRTHTSRRTWLVSSPRKDVWGKWQSQANARHWYMPTFGLDELQRCRAVAFPELPSALVELLHERWGGSARLTLKAAADWAQVALIKDAHNAAENTDLAAAVTAVAAADGGVGKDSRSLHILFHLAVTDGFDDCSPVLASDYCRDLVVAKLAAKGRQAVVDFITAAESSSAASSLRGHLFERLALSALFPGRRVWRLEPLGGPGPIEISPGPRTCVIFSDIDDLLRQPEWVGTPSAVGRPHDSNWPTWDAVTREDDSHTVTFWQMTISRPADHGIKAAGLVRAQRLVPDGYSARFIFVILPTARWPMPTAPVRIDVSAPDWARAMPQFVLRMDLDNIALADAGSAAVQAVAEAEEEKPELSTAFSTAPRRGRAYCQ